MNLVAARLRKGLSQAALAASIGAAKATVYNWENARNTPYPYYRRKLCEVLEVDDAEELLRVEDGEQVNADFPQPLLCSILAATLFYRSVTGRIPTPEQVQILLKIVHCDVKSHHITQCFQIILGEHGGKANESEKPTDDH